MEGPVTTSSSTGLDKPATNHNAASAHVPSNSVNHKPPLGATHNAPPGIVPRGPPSGMKALRLFERKDTPNPAQFKVACEKGFIKAMQDDPSLKLLPGFQEPEAEEEEEDDVDEGIAELSASLAKHGSIQEEDSEEDTDGQDT